MAGRSSRDRAGFLRRRLALTVDPSPDVVSMPSRNARSSDTKPEPKKQASIAAPPAAPPAPIAALFRPRSLIALALLVSAIAFVPRLVRLLPDLGARPAYRVAARDIRITPPPRWVPLDFTDQVVQSGNLPRDLSLLDDALTARVAEAFRRHPWVADVVQVRKGLPEGIAVDLKYREPAAMVVVPQGTYPVDANGILLPPADIPPADVQRFPLIQNVESSPGPAGQLWNDPAVLGAARLAAILQTGPAAEQSGWKRFHLAAIRVPRSTPSSRTLDDVVLELHTAGGSRIIWGRPPGTSHPGELSIEQKLGRLDKYEKDYGGFDHPHGPYEIDIRHWQEISRRSLANGPARTRRH